MTFFKLIRYPNLLMLVITLFLVQQTLQGFQSLINPALSDLNLGLYVLSSVLLAAGGYIINDIHDLKADRINKPNKVFVGKSISKKNALLSYWILSLSGVIIGLYVCFELNSLFNAVLCVATFVSLYIYTFFLQKKPLIGNLLISLLIPASMFALYIFEYDFENFSNGIFRFYLILPYIFFAFITNFMREMIKDIEDVDGDQNMGFKTLPILFGKRRTRNLVLLLNTILLLAIIFVLKLIIQLNYSNLFLGSIIVMIFIPSSMLFYNLWSAKTKREFRKISQLLKIIMVLGILTMTVIYF